MNHTRKANLDDLDQLSELFDQYRTCYNKSSDVAGAKVFLKSRLDNGDSKIFVAVDNGKLVGFTQLYPLFSSTRMKNYWLLNDLFVNEDHRGNGHSKALIEEAKNLCRSNNACGILLETDKTNDIGNQLYPATGFDHYTHANFYEWTNPDA